MDKFVKTIGANHGGSDEWYTPRYAVEPILKYLTPGARIWCPFDTEESEYYKVFTEKGYDVACTHISRGQDFLKARVRTKFDYIISNPPYSIRNDIYKKLYSLGIPFAMLYNSNGLFDAKVRSELARDNGVQLLYLYPRVHFRDRDGKENSPPFQSVYLCWKVLPEDIMFDVRENKC